MLKSLGRTVDAVLALDVQNEEVLRRLAGRTVCQNCQTPYTGRNAGDICEKCGGTLARRKDDDPEAMKTRLIVYDAQTLPVLQWYKQAGTKVAVIDAAGSVEDVTARALEALGKKPGARA
jgi:adenylate kinase